MSTFLAGAEVAIFVLVLLSGEGIMEFVFVSTLVEGILGLGSNRLIEAGMDINMSLGRWGPMKDVGVVEEVEGIGISCEEVWVSGRLWERNWTSS